MIHSLARTRFAGRAASLACVLPALGCILLLACMAPSVSQPQARPAPPPTTTGDSPAVTADTMEVAQAPDRPRVMVVVKGVPKDDIIAVDDRMLEIEPTEKAIADAFQSRGFPVVGAATLRQYLRKEQLRRMLEGDNRAAAEAGLGVEADMVVVGTLQEWRDRQAETASGDTSRMVRLRLATRAVNAATGAVVTSNLLELSRQSGDDASRQLAADSAVSSLSVGILETWKMRTRVTRIYADNADYQRVQLFKSTILTEANGIDSVVTLSLGGRSAELEVFSRLSSDELLIQVYRCVTAIPYVVTGVSGDRINIRFQDSPERCEPELK